MVIHKLFELDPTISMEPRQCTAEIFLFVASGMTGRASGLHSMPEKRRFTSLFGTSPNICAYVWGGLGNMLPIGGEPQHLLWGLLLIKVYATEQVLSIIAGVDRKTYRKWAWKFISAVSELKVVRTKWTIRY